MAAKTQSRSLRIALKLLRLGLAPIPCWTPAQCAAKQCSVFRRPKWLVEGRPWTAPEACDRPGKHPRIAWKKYQAEQPTEADVRKWFRQWPDANIAIATGQRYGIVVVDADSPEALAWCQAHLTSTPLGSLTGIRDKATGWRGRQLYMRHPGTPISNKAKIRTPDGKLDLDLRADGGYVMAPGSVHPSGVTYEAVGEWNPATFEDLPCLDAGLVQDAAPGHGRMSVYERAVRFAKVKGPAISGQGGHTHTYKLACDLVIGFALTDGEAMAVMRGEWNASCVPPWSDGELQELIRGARTSGKGRMGYLLDEQLHTPSNGAGLHARRNGKNGAHSAPAPVDDSVPTETPAASAPAAETPTAQPDAPDAGPAPAGKLLEAPMTDYGNAERLAELCYDKNGDPVVHWCKARDQWLIWTGKRWQWDEVGRVEQRAKRVVRNLYAAAVALPEDNPRREHLIKHARRTEGLQRMRAMMELFKTEPKVSVTHDEIDAHDWLLNCRNGIVDLRTGELRPHDKGLLLTRMAQAEYSEHADCPKWTGFLDYVMGGDQDRITFLQTAAGAALSGAPWQYLIFLYGTGANGKSVFLEVIARIFGDYAGEAAQGLLLQKKNEAHPTEVADLVGRRFVTSEEVDQSSSLDEGRVKRLTSGRPIKARFMREDLFEFRPTHKLWIAVNHKPRVRGQDEGIWRRIKTCPFEVVIPEAQRRPFDEVVNDLLTERNEILRWLVDGCLRWQRDGLHEPESVRAATREYRTSQDAFGRFVEDCIAIPKDELAPYCKVRSSDLYKAYIDWCQREGERMPMTQTTFSIRLQERGFKSEKKGSVFWLGISLKTERQGEGQT